MSRKSARKRPKRGPKRPQGRPWGHTRASQEGSRPSTEWPKGARGLASGSSGKAKSTTSRLQKRKKSNLRKVLRDSALPTFWGLRLPPDRPQIVQKSVPKTCCFLASVFQGLGLHFGAFWASMLEPNWLKIEKNLVWVCSGCGL